MNNVKDATLLFITPLTIWLGGAGYRSGEFSVASGGVGEYLHAVVGVRHEAGQRRGGSDHGRQPRRVEFRLSRLVRLRKWDKEDTIAFNLSVPGLV